MNNWQRIEPTTVTKVGWRTIVTKTFMMPDGKTVTFDTFGSEGQEFVAIIALTPDNKVIITHQYRPGPEKLFCELPGGFVDSGENLNRAALRELKEETGYSSDTLEYLGSYHKDTYMNAEWHVFFAENCILKGEQNLDDEEHIEVKLISVDELLKNATSDKMTDAVAVLMAYNKLQELRK